MNRDEQIEIMRRIELLRYGQPRREEDLCAIEARVDVWLLGLPQSDKERLRRAHCMARRLFGPAFRATTDGQRWTWIDICERARVMRPSGAASSGRESRAA